MVRARLVLVIAAAFALTACNKSSPPPQEPVKPRAIAAIEVPLRLPAL
jgi:hypothetical protein